jgi:hypothetical protein
MKDKSLQVENGNFTRIVNPVLDELVKFPFKGCELSIAIFIIRKTWGYGKTEDAISLTQIQQGVNRSRQTVVTALKNLELVNMVRLVKRGSVRNDSNIWSFNKYIDNWKLVKTVRLVKRNAKPSLMERPNLVYTPRHTKDTTKESKDRTKFKIPSLEDITKYCLVRKNSIDPEHFLNKHIANGWMVGKNKMKDWQATVRTWERQPWNKPKELTLKQRIQETIKAKGNLKIGKVNLSDLISCIEMVEDGSIDKQFDNITEILNSEEFKTIIL